ncbi:conserved hypothetical protein [Ricinus communis]|uniref:Uncharacterized protein n=1 Tax=Ricinus communis TaxID=3988 RepID=B9SAD8_RICCO|nr:conserved hypothetical protein [Ricinus communis]
MITVESFECSLAGLLKVLRRKSKKNSKQEPIEKVSTILKKIVEVVVEFGEIIFLDAVAKLEKTISKTQKHLAVKGDIAPSFSLGVTLEEKDESGQLPTKDVGAYDLQEKEIGIETDIGAYVSIAIAEQAQ